MNQNLQTILLSQLDPHPQNPRLCSNEEVIEAIKASINGQGFDPAHAIIARPHEGRLQIISGHHRYEACKRANLSNIPVWVREMDDDAAYMELVKSNAQSELTALERGLHALHSSMDVKAYAESIGRARTSVQDEVKAARVADAVTHVRHDLSGHFRDLAEIHAAPRWLWAALVNKLVVDELSVNDTKRLVAEHKGIAEPFSWLDGPAIATALVGGTMLHTELEKIETILERAHAAIDKAELNIEKYKAALIEVLAEKRPARLTQVIEICNDVINEQAKEAADARNNELTAQRNLEEREQKIATLRSNVSLDVWKQLDDPTKTMLLDITKLRGSSTFNPQKNDAIEWAQWSWNPVTGCLHDCPYCYARDIAQSERMSKAYPHGFEPAFRPNALLAPQRTTVPEEAKTDTRFRNVFTCSMADLFGRWVPAEWITAVLDTVCANPQWNFLFLTKFPKRMAEFDIPDNAWMGTTVDLQARVKNAETAFAKVKAGIRWLSVEPMLEPLRFERLDLFQWIVIGGSSRSSKTPEWKPPYEWHADLTAQARAAGVKVYHKTNLLGSRLLELPFDAPIKADPARAPDVFHYLGKARDLETNESK